MSRLNQTILQRGLLPVVMLGLGIASLVWGMKHHILEIYEEQEIEISIAPPPEIIFPMDPPGPPPELQTVTQVVLMSEEEPESQAVFEITIGGLALLETGELMRTYSGAPPSLCPT